MTVSRLKRRDASLHTAPIASPRRPTPTEAAVNEEEWDLAPFNWPSDVEWLASSCVASSLLPPAIVLQLCTAPSSSSPFHPRQLRKRNLVSIVPITPSTPFVPAYGSTLTQHPAQGQYGLFARCDLEPDTLLLPYLGKAHLSTPADQDDESEYDASISVVLQATSSNLASVGGEKSDTVRCGIDATHCGNEARFVNDYRGILKRPNVFFKDVERAFPKKLAKAKDAAVAADSGDKEEIEVELPKKIKTLCIFTGAHPIKAGTELCVSYGKGWWAARNGQEEG